MTQRPLPTTMNIEAEAARIERMIEDVTKKLESSHCDLRTFMHLQVCRTELQTYFAGLLYTMGYTNLIDTEHVEAHLNASNNERLASIAESFKSVGINDCLEKGSRLVQCFEC